MEVLVVACGIDTCADVSPGSMHRTSAKRSIEQMALNLQGQEMISLPFAPHHQSHTHHVQSEVGGQTNHPWMCVS